MHHLPTEVLDLILDQTCRAGLSQVLLANRFLHTLALRILYCAPSSGSCEDEPTLSTKQQVLLLQTLARQQSLDGLSKPNDFVRSLSLHFTNNTVTPNLVRLIQSALRTLPNLVDLDLQFSVFDNYHKFSWCLTGCPFQLQRLKTSMYYDATLANFLASQPSIAELSMSGLASNPPALLPSDALPRLNTLRNAHVQSGSLAHFITGRAVEAASLTLPWDDWQSALDVLTTGRVPLQRLTLLCLDADCAEVLFAELASRLPGLVALHAVFFMSIMSHTKLLTLGRDLAPLRHLRYVTFMGPDSGTVEEEREIVVAWSDACPSLTTIILPLGQVWHKQPNGKWHCFEDTDE